MYRNGTMETKDQEANGFAFMKTSCMHCGDPSCVSACPVSAMTKDPETGVVGYNPDKCIGCRYCVAACPFGIPKYQYDSPTGRIGKCELCRHRHKDGHYSPAPRSARPARRCSAAPKTCWPKPSAAWRTSRASR
jgi:Fe-S-cluster-containing dehydrogenase component